MKAFYASEQKRHDPKAFLSSGAPQAQSGAAGARRAAVGGRPQGRLRVRAAEELRAGADRGRPHAGISRFPRTHLRALAAHRGRVGGGHPQHPPVRARRLLSGLRRRPGRLSHGRYLLPDLRRDLRQRLLERLVGGRGGRGGACRRAFRLRALPAAGPSRFRRCRRRLLLPQQFGHRRAASAGQRGARRHPRCRPAPRQRHARHLLRAAPMFSPCRSMPIPCGSIRSSGAMPTSAARAPASATISTCRCRASPATRHSWRRWTSAFRRIRAFAPEALVVALGLDAFEGDPFGGLSVTTPGFSRIGEAIAAAGPADRDRSGGRLSVRRARRQPHRFP